MNGYCEICGNYGALNELGQCAYCAIILEELRIQIPDHEVRDE